MLLNGEMKAIQEEIACTAGMILGACAAVVSRAAVAVRCQNHKKPFTMISVQVVCVLFFGYFAITVAGPVLPIVDRGCHKSVPGITVHGAVIYSDGSNDQRI